jgi:hypothetical protein
MNLLDLGLLKTKPFESADAMFQKIERDKDIRETVPKHLTSLECELP